MRCAPYGEWVHPDDRDALVDLAAAAYDRDPGRFCPVELRILARDRRYWWTRWYLSVAGEHPSVSASGVDLLGRHDGSGPAIGTWRWDADADVVVWSPELFDMFDLAVGPPVSYDEFLAVVHTDDRDDVDRWAKWSLVTGEPYVADFRAYGGGDGRDRWFHAVGRFEPAGDRSNRQLCGIVKYLNPPGGG
jgi:hypothetical protein